MTPNTMWYTGSDLRKGKGEIGEIPVNYRFSF